MKGILFETKGNLIHAVTGEIFRGAQNAEAGKLLHHDLVQEINGSL